MLAPAMIIFLIIPHPAFRTWRQFGIMALMKDYGMRQMLEAGGGVLFLLIALSITAAGQTPTPSPAKTPAPPDDVDVPAGHCHLGFVIHADHHRVPFPAAGTWHTGGSVKSNSDRPGALSFVLRDEPHADVDI